jgi:glycosyltransferase involved in cell wall biosynthesis
VIVVDDGSANRSQTVIDSYGDRILSLFQANGGQASAFNSGFAKSCGEIICFLDADDFFAPTKAAEIAALFAADSEVQWCSHPLTLVDETTQKVLVQPTEFSSRRCDVRRVMQRRGTLKGQLPALIPAASGLCFRRSLLQQILPMPESDTITISDSYLKFIAVGIAPGFFSHQPLAFQRIHGSNAYTHHPCQQPVTANISIATAYWMNHRFHALGKLADNLLAMGVGIAQSLGGVEPKSQVWVDRYRQSLSLPRKLKVSAKTFYHWLKARLISEAP